MTLSRTAILTYLKKLLQVFIASGKSFIGNKIPKLSGSLAYFTFFSLAPLLTLVISITSIFYGQEATQGKLYAQIKDFLGHEAGLQIQSLISNAQLSGNNFFALSIGISILIIGATAVFIEMQDSINYIWHIKAVPKRGWTKLIKDRLLSFSLIITLSFLLLITLTINSITLSLAAYITSHFSDYTLILINVINWVISFGTTTLIFMVIFKILPDVEIKWNTVIPGAIFTSILFILGRLSIEFYISKTNPGAAYGAASSVIIILIWIYYTSIILYFGAVFTQAYTEIFGGKIRPSKFAVYLKVIEEKIETTEIPKQLLP